MSDAVTIARINSGFAEWDELLALILRSFASMNGRIDPPSSALRLTPEGLRAKSRDEIGIVARRERKIAGCAFLAEREGCFYLGKLAVDPALQGLGIGRQLVEWCERHARGAGKPAIELQTRVELTENHAAFGRMGFVETGRTAHAGFDRPTSLTMRKVLA